MEMPGFDEDRRKKVVMEKRVCHGGLKDASKTHILARCPHLKC